MSLAHSTPRAVRTAPGQQYDVRRCECCQKHYPLDYGFNRRFCRRECKYRDLADDLLDDIRYDHRHCSSCYREIKTVEPPTLSKKSAELGKSIPECAVGRQRYREHAMRDQRNTHHPSDANALTDRLYASVTMDARMGCSCPANHHSTVRELPADAEWTKRTAIRHTERLADALDALAARGVHSTEFDRDTLFGFVRKSKTRNSNTARDDREILRNGLALAIQHA